jgi:hypothetical protein
VLVVLGLWHLVNASIAPLLFNARIERINEPTLPRIIIEQGPVVYCRMRADGFRLPLPGGAVLREVRLTNGRFDSAEGWVEMGVKDERTVAEFERSLLALPPGATVGLEGSGSRLWVSFRYFGDR